MYRRLITVSVIILLALGGLTWLGLYSINLQAEGLENKRYAEFRDVAEQIRLDVNRKLDEFIQAEQARPYTDYQYYYIPEASNDATAIVRSPLAENLSNGMAFGYFQIEPDGSIITPYTSADQGPAQSLLLQSYIKELKENLPAMLSGNGNGFSPLLVERLSARSNLLSGPSGRSDIYSPKKKDSSYAEQKSQKAEDELQIPAQGKKALVQGKARSRRSENPINIIGNTQQTRIENRTRGNVALNSIQNVAQSSVDKPGNVDVMQKFMEQPGMPDLRYMQAIDEHVRSIEPQKEQSPQLEKTKQQEQAATESQQEQVLQQEDMVQIRIEPFIPVAIDDPDKTDTDMLNANVFLLRHIQIEQDHFLQGFKLDETELIDEINESADRLVRRGMGVTLSREEDTHAAHVAILDFGFGQIVLNMAEIDPAWIGRQISTQKNWYFGILAVVFAAVGLALAGLWRSANAQLKLARKKDDFISAVSHELRTPLTSIRMYTEMLEKDWIKNESKRSEYYSTMRQESERLTRLIDNVLDFSRIQRGKKKYSFQMGGINECVGEVIDMMKPYAREAGFEIKRDFSIVGQSMFDRDSVTQIVVNLIDNAIKYAKNGDKIIIIRTKSEEGYVVIEVEDHGPGIPYLQKKKIFDEFYRIGDESTREATGTGLGLALVKKLAMAHNGFVDVLAAKPNGAIFRAGLSRWP